MLKRKDIPSVERLNELFEYRNGNLYHRRTRKGATEGQLAGKHNTAYPVVKIDGNSYKLHRVIFVMHNGYCPDEVDHIDGNTHNNLIENLRAAKRAENMRNVKLSATNKSGVKNVSLHVRSGLWQAHISVNGKRKHLGMFSSLNLAAEFVDLARGMVYGKFANRGVYA
jgi:hypothetical protein